MKRQASVTVTVQIKITPAERESWGAAADREYGLSLSAWARLHLGRAAKAGSVPPPDPVRDEPRYFPFGFAAQPERRSAYEAAARAADTSLSDWVRRTLNAAAARSAA